MVFGVIAFAKFSGSSGSTKVTSMPSLRKVCSNWVNVPPYSVRAVTIWSPGTSIVISAMNCAACPEAVATAPAPPSSEAIRSSKAAVVGFMIRV